VTDRESNPRPLGRMTGDSTTRLKRSAVMSGTGIHRLIYRDICVERGASYAACAAHTTTFLRVGTVPLRVETNPALIHFRFRGGKGALHA